jgi:hypothetical protein
MGLKVHVADAAILPLVLSGAQSRTLMELGGGFVHQVQLFARLEANRLARSNADFRAGPGITPDAGLPRLNCEYAKPAQFDPVAGNQRLLHAVEDRVHRVFRLGPRKSGPLHDPLDKVLFNQVGPPLSLNSNRSVSHSTHCPALVMLGTKPKIVNASRLP